MAELWYRPAPLRSMVVGPVILVVSTTFVFLNALVVLFDKGTTSFPILSVAANGFLPDILLVEDIKVSGPCIGVCAACSLSWHSPKLR